MIPIVAMSRSLPPAFTGSARVMGNLAQQFSPDEMVVVGALRPGRSRPPGGGARIFYAAVWSPGWRGERWLRRLQLPWLVAAGAWVARRHGARAVLAVYPDEIFLLAGYILAGMLRLPLLLYFHNTYLENHRSSRLARWLQPRAFRRASHVFVMSEGMRRLYERRYPGLRTSSLLHTFLGDPPTFEPLSPLHDPVELLFLGQVGPSCADAAARLARAVNLTPGIRLTVVSGTARTTIERAGLAGPRIRVETVPDHALADRLRAADILVLPHGFTSPLAPEEIETIFPTKVVEYLASGRPILAHVPPGCYLAEFLTRHDAALVVDEPTEEAIGAALARLAGDATLRDSLARNAVKAARQFHAPAVAQHLRAVVGEVIAGGAR